jgi:hypothetical protein
MRASLDGSNPLVIAANQAHPEAITVDESSVYWANYAFDGRIMKASLEGQGIMEVAKSSGSTYGYPTAIAVDSTGVYWIASNSGRVMHAPLAGGDYELLWPYQPFNAGAMVIREGVVYWASSRRNGEDGVVLRTNLGDGKEATIASGQFGGESIAADSTAIVWPNWSIDGGFVGHIMMAPLSGGSATTFVGGACTDALFPPTGFASGVAIGGTQVYWMNDSELWKASR